MSRSVKSVQVLLILSLIKFSYQDVSHFLAAASDFNYFQNHHPLLTPQSQIPVAFQTELSSLYGPPPVVSDTARLYPKPISPSEIVTPAPVAPASSSSEFVLPEVVENRSVKDRRNFIPLSQKYSYIPPAPPTVDERPNYESPQQENPQYDPFNGGYIYQEPSATSTTTTTSSPENNDPIILPPISNDPIEHNQGYNYHAPTTSIIVAADSPFNQSSTSLYLLSTQDQQYSIIQNSDRKSPLRLRVHEMRCLQQDPKGSGYFRTVLKIDNFLSATPTVDNDAWDKRCEIKIRKSYVVIDVEGEDFIRCGVQQCGTDLCLRLRFPAIRGLRTGLDNILTLHCKSQSRVAIKTHAVTVGVANDVQARNIGTYAKGGTQNSFRTHVELLRKTPQGYVRHLKSNEAVQLGEDLILRTLVLTGDGWNYTKLTDVSLQRLSPSGEILNNVQLITSQGCVNPSMREICTQPPIFDAPLGYKLPFKAVMFQGMKSGEELVMYMRITGCLEHHDCYINTEQCNSSNIINLKRRRREMSNSATHNDTEISEISTISFRVIMPEKILTDKDIPAEEIDDFKVQTKSLILSSSLGFVALLMCLGIFVLIKFKQF